MGRSPCCSKVGLNRGAWTSSEDKTLTNYIKLHGEGNWRNLPKNSGLKRCGKSCRLRWLNYLRPDIKRGNISSDEEDLIVRLHKLLGNRWSLIAGRLPGRTDNEIKNYWNTTLCKKIQNNNQAQIYDQKSKKKTSKIEETTHNDHSSVVQTKAVRCSKTFCTPQPPSTNTVPLGPKEVPEKSDTEKPAATESGSPYWDSLFNTEENKENPSNFLLETDLGEMTESFLDFFSSDFNGVLDFDHYDIMNSKANEMSTSSNSSDEPAPFFSKEMMDHFSSIPGDWLAQ